MQHFDVLIVGAGSAGSVLANRLSADGKRTVGIIEAGEFPEDPDISDPLKWPVLQGRAFDRNYVTEAQTNTAGRRHSWPRGRIVGGSSCLHAMAHVRGHPDDFDEWAAAGGERWSYSGLLPGFEISEKFTANDAPGRGRDGPLDVVLPDGEVSPVVTAYMRAGQALGVPEISDHNSGQLIGTTANSLTIRDGLRLSVADAYLSDDVLARENLSVLTGCTVDTLLFDGARVVGVRAIRSGEQTDLFAKHIVISAGAVDSPLLLMRSGIGDPRTLADIGITCKYDRPGVGENLQDHLLVLGNVYGSRRPVPPSRLQHSESLMYLSSTDLCASSVKPDIVLACVVAPSVAEGLTGPAYGTAYTLLCGVTHPTSRGRIVPGGPGPEARPIIDPRYLDTEYDRATLRSALRIARKIGHHREMDAWRDCEVLPGKDVRSDKELDTFIAETASTHHHPVGTCRMGRDPGAVVDPDLRVIGTDNLFVVDASVMPSLTSGPVNAAVVAVAETWAMTAHNVLSD